MSFAATGLGTLLVLLLAPGGLVGILYSVRDGALRLVAIRNRIIVPSLLADTSASGDGRATMRPEKAPGGGTAFVPVRYRLAAQWTKFSERVHER